MTTISLSNKEPFVFYDRSRSIAISYYHIERWIYSGKEKERIYVHTPMKSNFVIEDPYFGGDMISSEFNSENSSSSLFKIPSLERLTHLLTNPFKNKTRSLIAVLWIKDHLLYSNQLVKSGHYFYRCIPQIGEEDTNYILIPLYARLGHYTQKKNPVMLYHSGSVSDTVLVKYPDVYQQLKDMFGPYVNAFPIVFNFTKSYMIQFNEEPACFLM